MILYNIGRPHGAKGRRWSNEAPATIGKVPTSSGYRNTREKAVLPDSAGCSQQTLLEAGSHALAKSIVITAAAAEDYGRHSQLALWLLF